MKVQFLETSSSCPQIFEAHYDNRLIGYTRFRHGYFRVNYHYDGVDCIVYEANPGKSDGVFHPDEENYYLSQAAMCLISEYERRFNNEPNYEIITRQSPKQKFII